MLRLSCSDKTERQVTLSAMNTITQDMRFMQAVIEYSLKHGVTKAAIRHKTGRQNIHRRRKKYDGTVRSLANGSHRPHSHPNQHTEAEIRLVRDMRRRNPHAGLVVFWVKLRQRGYIMGGMNSGRNAGEMRGFDIAADGMQMFRRPDGDKGNMRQPSGGGFPDRAQLPTEGGVPEAPAAQPGAEMQNGAPGASAMVLAVSAAALAGGIIFAALCKRRAGVQPPQTLYILFLARAKSYPSRRYSVRRSFAIW